ETEFGRLQNIKCEASITPILDRHLLRWLCYGSIKEISVAPHYRQIFARLPNSYCQHLRGINSREDKAMAATDAVLTFAEAGAVFNDATRFLEGGLWQNVVSEGGQGLGSVNAVVNDLQTVQATLQAQIAAGQFSGTALEHAQSIVSSLGEEITAATASVNGGGAYGSIAAAESALRSLHLGIINTVQGDATLAALATADGATGFQAVPAALPEGVTAQNAPHANLAQIGAIFNDAANLMLGGINSENVAAIRADINTARLALKQLMAEHPDEFGGLTGVHADTVVRQLAL